MQFVVGARQPHFLIFTKRITLESRNARDSQPGKRVWLLTKEKAHFLSTILALPLLTHGLTRLSKIFSFSLTYPLQVSFIQILRNIKGFRET